MYMHIYIWGDSQIGEVFGWRQPIRLCTPMSVCTRNNMGNTNTRPLDSYLKADPFNSAEEHREVIAHIHMYILRDTQQMYVYTYYVSAVFFCVTACVLH
jgi:hypothetical protein